MNEDLPSWLDGGSEHGVAQPPQAAEQRAPASVEWTRRASGAAGGEGRPNRARNRNSVRPRNRGAARRRRIATLGLLGLVAAGGLVAIIHAAGGGPAATTPGSPRGAGQGALPAVRYGPASPPPAWPGPLPYPVLIADQGNHRLLLVSPTKKVLWQYPPSGPKAPAAAGAAPAEFVSFAPDGGSVIATGEHESVLERIDFYTRTVLWHFGQVGHAGGGSSRLDRPTAGYLLKNGNVLVADVGNCRELLINPAGRVAAVWGQPQSGFCQTDTARRLFGYPNGDQPQANGDILMTFGSGDRIALLSSQGAVIWDKPAPTLYGGVASDAQMAAGGDVLITGYGHPGAVVLWNPQTGAVLWQYHVTSGPGALADPTLALPLPGGNVLVTDSGNNRVVVIDPQTGAIVWSYTGSSPGATLQDPSAAVLDLWRNWQTVEKP